MGSRQPHRNSRKKEEAAGRRSDSGSAQQRLNGISVGCARVCLSRRVACACCVGAVLADARSALPAPVSCESVLSSSAHRCSAGRHWRPHRWCFLSQDCASELLTVSVRFPSATASSRSSPPRAMRLSTTSTLPFGASRWWLKRSVVSNPLT